MRTKRVKNLVRCPSLVRPARDGRRMATSDSEPNIAAVFEEGNPPLVITVVQRTYDRWEHPCST